MVEWTFYPAFIATAVSILGLCSLATQLHDAKTPLNLSELVLKNKLSLRIFRFILWLCGSLFAVTAYGYILPRISNQYYLLASLSLLFFGELVLGVVPAVRGEPRFKLHDSCAKLMAFGMLATALLFALSLTGVYATAEIGITLAMTILVILTRVYPDKFLQYELAFIFVSHISILVAAFGLFAT